MFFLNLNCLFLHVHPHCFVLFVFMVNKILMKEYATMCLSALLQKNLCVVSIWELL